MLSLEQRLARLERQSGCVPQAGLLERITHVLYRARVAGGWIDDVVADAVLAEIGLTDAGEPIDRGAAAAE